MTAYGDAELDDYLPDFGEEMTVPSKTLDATLGFRGWAHVGAGVYENPRPEFAGHRIIVLDRAPGTWSPTPWTHFYPDGSTHDSAGDDALSYHLIVEDKRAGSHERDAS